LPLSRGWSASPAIRPEAAAALAQLRSGGVRQLLMFTGDSEESARSVAQLVGLSEWYARLLPEEKYDLIRRLKANGQRVVVVGDGINDAPALALADAGLPWGRWAPM